MSTELIQPSDILDPIREVLRRAHPGKVPTDRPNFITAYQILERLPTELHERLVDERGRGGAEGGSSFTAPSVIAKAALMLARTQEVEIEYLDTKGLKLGFPDDTRETGNPVCAIYRLRQAGIGQPA